MTIHNTTSLDPGSYELSCFRCRKGQCICQVPWMLGDVHRRSCLVDQFSRQFGMRCPGAAHWCDTVNFFLVLAGAGEYEIPSLPASIVCWITLWIGFETLFVANLFSPFSGSLDFMFLSIKRKHNWNTWNTKWFNCSTTWFSSRWQVFAVGKELFVVFALKWDAWKSCVRWTMRPWWNIIWYQCRLHIFEGRPCFWNELPWWCANVFFLICCLIVWH